MERVIIDVREPLEYRLGHVKGAINIPPSQMMAGAKKLEGLPKDTELVLYCVSGSHSAFLTAFLMVANAFSTVSNSTFFEISNSNGTLM